MRTIKISYKELLFQVLVHMVVFLFYALDKDDTVISMHEVVFFATYASAGIFINFFLMPRFYKTKDLYQTILYIVFTILLVVFVEEYIIEPFFFDDIRGKTIKLILASISIVPIIMILTGFKFGWDAIYMQREMDNLKETARKNELQFLKSQINPHFLFNNLNNLYAYALEASPKTPEIILELSGLLRYMLYECKEKYVSLRKEVEQLENFINLNELQIETRGQVDFKSSGVKDGFKIAPLILIVFIENAFKHSVSSQSNAINVNIKIDVDDDGLLNFICKNSYQNTTNTKDLANGIGLANVKKRLDLLYKDNYQLDCTSEDNIYKVQLVMQLKNENA